MKARKLIALAALAAAAGCVDRVQVGKNNKDLEGEPVPATHTGRIDKVDLLFVIDNSRNMTDKQRELARRVPEMIRALTLPPPGSQWSAVRDLHVAFITSSLGSHGTSACSTAITNPMSDDRGYPLPRRPIASGVDAGPTDPPTYACKPQSARTVLRWVADGGESIDDLAMAAACIAESASEFGCEYEAPLEAMYRFLIDPAPYQSAQVQCTFGIHGDSCEGALVPTGIDSELLAHRSTFLRPDSLVAVVLLSDENDASLAIGGTNWHVFAAGSRTMPRGNTACSSVPDDADDLDDKTLFSRFKCRSCAESPDDPGCSDAWPLATLNVDVDSRNVRALRNVQRFGRSYLWPVQRYVDGLSKRLVLGSDGKFAVNPLFATNARALDMVMLAGIVGVPRPLVENGDGSPRTLSDADWETIASADPAKRDPHMIESVAPRARLAKFAGDRSIDPVHGGERDITNGDDLQYACIAPRESTLVHSSYADCIDDAASRSPLCGDGGQPYFKAYPAIRPLRAIRALGARGHVASICNASYAAAIAGITEKIHVARGN